MSELTDRAIIFATGKHASQVRKFAGTPYILHPLEVASIIASLTPDEEVIAAGILHDTIEDCGASPSEIEELFGARVMSLVCSETEDKLPDRPAGETWLIRKKESLKELDSCCAEVKILWLADKLSNMRSFCSEHEADGDAMWQKMNQKDISLQKWYYYSVLEKLGELSYSRAYRELKWLTDELFGGEGNE